MLRYLLTPLLLLFCVSVSAQQPTILATTLIPVNPAGNNPVKIVTHLQTPYSAFVVDKQFTVSPQSHIIKLHLCYANGMATVISHHIDTFAVGALASGAYSIYLSAYISSAGQHCARVDSNFATITFTASGAVQLDENTVSPPIVIYPQPAAGHIIICPPHNKCVRLFSVQGQFLRAADLPSSGFFPLDGIPAGIYIAEIRSPEGSQTRRIIIQ